MKNSLTSLSLLGLLAFAPQISAQEEHDVLAEQMAQAGLVEVSQEVAEALQAEGRSILVVEEVVMSEEAATEDEAVRSAFSADTYDKMAQLASCEKEDVEALLFSLLDQVDKEKLSKFSFNPSHIISTFQHVMASENIHMTSERAELLAQLAQAYLSHHATHQAQQASNQNNSNK